MADEPVDTEQTRRIDELTQRLERLGSALAASPVVGASVRDLFAAVPVPLAIPPDVADGQVITAAHINAIKQSVYYWQVNVDALDRDLLRVAHIAVGAGNVTPQALLHIKAVNVAGVDSVTGIMMDRLYDAVGDSMDIHWGPTGRLSMAATGGGEGGFIFYAQTGGGDGSMNECFRIDGNGQCFMKRLRSTNPGAGSKQIWYDPADGNRVKFAP